MSDIRPVAALRYARDPEPRIAPPYDVISEAERTRYASEPENVVHLTLPPGPEGARDYEDAARTLRRWVDGAVLVRDPNPSLYLLQERTPEGTTRKGIFGLVRLAEYGERVVLPHERTMRGPKEDRLLLTRATRANLEPLFFLYEDREDVLAETYDAATSGPALARVKGPQGVDLALFAIDDAASVRRVHEILLDRSLVIADGHHRYETMLRYREECRAAAGSPDAEAPYEFVLGYFVNAFDAGTQVKAIHRVVSAPLEALRERARAARFVEEALDPKMEPPALLGLLSGLRESTHAVVAAGARGDRLLLRRDRAEVLDVEVVHGELLTEAWDVRFDAEPARAIEAARKGGGTALLLNPVSPDELFGVVREGRVLPQKSTYFSPKVPSGLLLRDLA
jgi:uncharacterized protein (DUF1015 family)